jgi:hypothetical protein
VCSHGASLPSSVLEKPTSTAFLAQRYAFGAFPDPDGNPDRRGTFGEVDRVYKLKVGQLLLHLTPKLQKRRPQPRPRVVLGMPGFWPRPQDFVAPIDEIVKDDCPAHRHIRRDIGDVPPRPQGAVVSIDGYQIERRRAIPAVVPSRGNALVTVERKLAVEEGRQYIMAVPRQEDWLRSNTRQARGKLIRDELWPRVLRSRVVSNP